LFLSASLCISATLGNGLFSGDVVVLIAAAADTSCRVVVVVAVAAAAAATIQISKLNLD
jgi:hypothetical protein